MSTSTVWIFNGHKAAFPSGVFAHREQATNWIAQHKLSGVLTEYPVDTGTLDWAITNQFFLPKKPEHSQAKFIQSFTSSRQRHEHYEEGTLVA
ncbi:hypothetical protein RAE19_03885 [Rhodoferax sp. TBRC 17660]|uniref:DUF7710 domain-containing protein n=1 Tax=Rhodoferax potami TaxID=3068338 RepID=A0ABU3KJH0_9BURK|nr:hypothetical protein [Rhodoferax sp. TBRC 17660]MDT7517887.1 hypothetical protein [Rhodoferax sp. TBRC 17660]